MAITGKQLAQAARNAYQENKGRSIPKRLGGSSLAGMDTGGFIKYCFEQCGETFNLKGTNDLFRRNHIWRDTLENSRKNNRTPDGAIAFIVKQDGGEREKGYRDGLGNAITAGIVSNKQIIYYSGDKMAIVEVRINSTNDTVCRKPL